MSYSSPYYKAFALIVILSFGGLELPVLNAQHEKEPEFYIDGKANKRITIPFELINNLVIIEASINGSEPLKFVLDTGVGTTLITGLPNNEQITLENSRKVTIAGLGEDEPLEAYLSKNNTLKLRGTEGENLDLVFLLEDIFSLSSFMGTFVHGLIGYDLFAHFAVEINYKRKHIYLYDPESFKKKFERLPRHRKWKKIPIILEKNKPYVLLNYKHSETDSVRQVKLLIDSGASNAFSFYEITEDFFKIPQANIQTMLGMGLNGAVNGKMGRVEEVLMGDFKFNRPVVAFPDSVSIRNALRLTNSNGSMGGEILRRFKIIFHYQNGYILVRSNNDLNDKFTYNMSGIEVITPVPNLPLYVVSKVRPGSPADLAGVEVDDIIEKINGKSTEKLSLNDLLNYFERKEGSQIRMDLQRDSTIKNIDFTLRNELNVDFQ